MGDLTGGFIGACVRACVCVFRVCTSCVCMHVLMRVYVFVCVCSCFCVHVEYHN